MAHARAGLGLGLAVVSATTFGTSGSLAAGLLAGGWSPGAAVTLRVGLAAVVLSIPALVALRGRWRGFARSLPSVVAYGVGAVAVAQLCYFNAVEHLSVAVALLLEYSGTLLVVGWMWARHAQRPRRLTVAGAVLAVVGLVLVLDLTGRQHVDGVGVLWGLGAATGLACYFVLSAGAGAGDPAGSGDPAEPTGGSSAPDGVVPAIAMAWGGLVAGTLCLLLLGVVGVMPMRANRHRVDYDGHVVSWWVPVLGLSLVAAVIAYTTGIGAARLLGARLASFVGLAEVLAATICAWLLLGQRPGLEQAVGGLVVLVGIALVRADERDPESGAVDPLPAAAGSIRA